MVSRVLNDCVGGTPGCRCTDSGAALPLSAQALPSASLRRSVVQLPADFPMDVADAIFNDLPARQKVAAM